MPGIPINEVEAVRAAMRGLSQTDVQSRMPPGFNKRVVALRDACTAYLREVEGIIVAAQILEEAQSHGE